MKLDELVLSVDAIGDAVADNRALVIRLVSLTENYQHVTKIFENMTNINRMCAKGILQREWQNIQRNESNEVALKATKVKFKQREIPNKNDGMFLNGRCFICNKPGHRQKNCRQNTAKSEKKQSPTTRWICIYANSK